MTTNIKVTASNMGQLVRDTYEYCCYKAGEDQGKPIEVEGRTRLFELHAERLEEKRELVAKLLDELPEEFADGHSYFNICLTKECHQWTDEHMDCEELIALAIGLDLMMYSIARPMWNILPGGLPYLTIK